MNIFQNHHFPVNKSHLIYVMGRIKNFLEGIYFVGESILNFPDNPKWSATDVADNPESLVQMWFEMFIKLLGVDLVLGLVHPNIDYRLAFKSWYNI